MSTMETTTTETKAKKKTPARAYDKEYKQEAVRLGQKVGVTAAARELGIPENTLYGWMRKNKQGELAVPGIATSPQTANALADEVAQLKGEIRELRRKLAEEEEINEILDKAARFFALGQRK